MKQRIVPKILRVFTSSVSVELVKGQYQFMQDHGFEMICAAGRPYEGLDALEEREAIRTIPVEHLVRPVSFWNDLGAIFEMIRIIRREKPDIVHTHTPKAGMVGMLAAKWCGVPIRIHTVAGLPLMVYSGFKRKVLNFIESLTYKCATRVYPNSYALKDFIVSEGLAKEEKLGVLGNGSSNGINLDQFVRTPELEQQAAEIRKKVGGDFIYLFVGRIVKDKGITELVDAFTRIHDEHSETRLILVGNPEPNLDPLPDRIQAAIRENDGIYEAGWQDNVRPWFIASDLFTFPSYREGFPNVVMQAGALGVPSIVTDINGSNEIIIEGENGSIIPTHDSEALYRKMSEVLQNRDKLAEMSTKCRPLIASRYDQKDVWAATLQMYMDLLKPKSE